MDAKSKIVKLPEEAYEAAIRQYSREGAHIPGDDDTNPWIPFVTLPQSSISASTYVQIRSPTSFG